VHLLQHFGDAIERIRLLKHITMPHKERSAEGVRTKTRKGSDKARRTFELHGSNSAKHVRVREAAAQKSREGRAELGQRRTTS